MSPDEWLTRNFGKEFFSGNFDHLKTIISKLNLGPQNCQVITVAGTNGKGETVRALAAFFDQANISYVLLTSPHIHHVNERFRINGVDVSNDALLESFHHIHLSTINEKLSYFEFLYLVYLHLVSIIKPQIVLQEVGLGGRLDATNSIHADIAVVTSISRDHQEFLGDKFSQILYEKLGITRKKSQLVSALELRYLRQLTAKWCSERKISWFDIFSSKDVDLGVDFSSRNRVLARKVFYLSQGVAAPELEQVRTFGPGKTILRNDALWHLYPTHNVDGLRKLIHFLGEELYNIEDLVLFAPSKRNAHDLETMVKILLKRFEKKQIRLVHFKHLKALEQNKSKLLGSKFGIEIVEDIKKFSQPKSTRNVLVVGSNYFLGSINS